MRSTGTNTSSRARWAQAAAISATAFLVLFLLIIRRTSNATTTWFNLEDSDAARYLGLTNGVPQPYPWGGRWLVPTIAGWLPLEAPLALLIVSSIFALGALMLISRLALEVDGATWRTVAVAWVFAAGGAALPLMFQTPALTDSAGLGFIALFGLLYVRGTDRDLWAMALLVPVGVTARESLVGFLLLLVLRRKWLPLVVGGVLSLGALAWGFLISGPTKGAAINLDLTTVPKVYLGLGALWLFAIAGLWCMLRGRLSLPSQYKQFFVAVFVLGIVSLPMATDTPRLQLFLLPAAVPIAAWLAGACRGRVQAWAWLAALPAALWALPTHLTAWALPPDIASLDEWYLANAIVISIGLLGAAAGAVVIIRCALRSSAPAGSGGLR